MLLNISFKYFKSLLIGLYLRVVRDGLLYILLPQLVGGIS